MIRFKITFGVFLALLNFKLKTIVNYLDRQNSCLNVFFTACLTSLIIQQYRNGFNDEFK